MTSWCRTIGRDTILYRTDSFDVKQGTWLWSELVYSELVYSELVYNVLVYS